MPLQSNNQGFSLRYSQRLRASYQVALVVSSQEQVDHPVVLEVREEVEKAARQLGVEVLFLVQESAARIDGGRPVAGVYLGIGRPTASTYQALEDLHARTPAVLPVDVSGGLSRSRLPQWLETTGRISWEGQATAPKVAEWCLEELQLLHRQQRVFLSYCRRDAAKAAEGLYKELSFRGFDVFLDVAGIRNGEDFPAVLSDAVIDSEVSVFLDSAGALGSRWCQEELKYAQRAGVPALHICWPGVERAGLAEAFDAFYLESGSFWSRKNHDGKLKPKAIERIRRRIEDLRAQAVAHRRNRSFGELIKQAEALQLRVNRVEPDFVEVQVDATPAAPAAGQPTRCYLSAGHPRVRQMREIHERRTEPISDALLYEDHGLVAQRSEDIDFLRKRLQTEFWPLGEIFDHLLSLP